jgi:hypothetical protein
MSPATTGVLDAVRDATVGKDGEPIESEARACAVTDEALAADIVVRFDSHRSVEVFAVRAPR